MDVGSIFLILAVALLVTIFVGQPFFENQSVSAQDSDLSADHEHQYSSLLAERDRILNSIQEMDFDNTLGKIPPAEYKALRAELLAKGADILRRLDQIEAASPETESLTAENRIEEVIAAHRISSGDAWSEEEQSFSSPSDKIEELIAARRYAREESSGGFCPKCGKPVLRTDKFCSKCGATLS